LVPIRRDSVPAAVPGQPHKRAEMRRSEAVQIRKGDPAAFPPAGRRGSAPPLQSQVRRQPMARLLRDMDEPEMRRYFNLLARATASILPEDAGEFVLLVISGGTRCHYVGNVDPSIMIKVMRAMADRLEAEECIIP
jgi:hypothetical protein